VIAGGTGGCCRPTAARGRQGRGRRGPGNLATSRAARRLGDARRQITFIDSEIDWRERELLTSTKLTDRRRAEPVAEVGSLERQRDRAIVDRSDAGAALEHTRRLLGL